MALFLKPDPADIRAARRDIHREALIRGVASIAQSAQPAAVTALSELLDEGVVTRRGDRGVAIADDTDVYRAARAIMLELESGGGTLSVEGLHDRIEHTAPTTHTALNYLRAHKLVALRDGVLTDRTGDKMRGRKSALPTESLELAAIAAADAAVRKNIAALGDSTTRWFKHPDDDRWTPEALREVLVTIAAKLHRAAKEVKEGKRADPTLTNNEVKKSLSNRPLRGETVAPRDRFEEARQLGLRTGVIRTTHRSRLVFVSFEPLMESDDFGRRVANMGVRVAARTKGLVDAATNRVGVGK
ncbi:hypothetical protein [Mycobacteroides abscessus]|uniref:hypothetical protein n=1 Tax=Mycobacteroides abscessus TaxID=36809 RepID=UPI002647FC09|nr:hypothetical protein [Mycobacteroides abscessus]MDO3357788.1 hypothetical protein [Mycobacteroides abscessus subsp. massiliense]WKE45641.1 hypothetical protein P3M63_07505 [Mycobacteroides abscessus subsp. massiliense]